jgi:hypothetical protein
VIGNAREIDFLKQPLLDGGIALGGVGDDQVKGRLLRRRGFEPGNAVPPAGVENGAGTRGRLETWEEDLAHHAFVIAAVDEDAQLAARGIDEPPATRQSQAAGAGPTQELAAAGARHAELTPREESVGAEGRV